jgi:hypothetical protein
MAELNFPTAAAANVKPLPQTSLSDMLGMARSLQDYQQAQQVNPLNLQRLQQLAEQERQVQPLQLRQQQALTTGVETKLPFEIRSSEAAAKSAEATSESNRIAAEKAGVDLNKYYTDLSRNIYGGLLSDPAFNPENPNPAKMIEKLDAAQHVLNKGFNIPKHENGSHDQLLKMVKANPKEAIQTIANGIFQAQAPSEQGALLSRAPTAFSTGEGTLLQPTSPFQQGQQGKFIESQIPTGTAITLGEGNPYGLPVGTQILKPPVSQAPKNVGPTVGALAPQVASTIAANTAVANEDWKQTTAAAQTAPQRIATFQNIKKLAPESFTAVGGEKKALASGIANALGISAYEAENTATQELIKNTKLLAIAGGNTDAARQLAEAANPNNKMNVPAIKNIADMMIGVEKMNLARQKYLASARDNPSTYQQKMQEFIPFMDSRLYQEMTAKDVKKLKSSMSANEQAEISAKIKKARQLGIL